MSPRRLLLRLPALEVLRRAALPPEVALPPGFVLEPRPGADLDGALAAASADLRRQGLADEAGAVHPALVEDLRLLAAPEVAVAVRAARPGLQVWAFLAVAGARGIGLLRTDEAVVQLSAFASVDLGRELARVVPAAVGRAPLSGPVTVPLTDLLDDRPGGGAASLHARWGGALHATVVGRRPHPPVEWVWLGSGDGSDGGGWAGLEPGPGGTARVVPVEPADLGTWLAPAVAQALADGAAA